MRADDVVEEQGSRHFCLGEQIADDLARFLCIPFDTFISHTLRIDKPKVLDLFSCYFLYSNPLLISQGLEVLLNN